MEILIGAVIVILIAVILGVEVQVILSGILIAVEVLMAVMLAFFIVYLCKLLKCKKCTGRFVKFDKPPKYKYSVAYYEVDGELYPGVFPHEKIMQGRIYTPDKQVKLMVDKKNRRAFDKNILITVFAGLILVPVFMVWVFSCMGRI